MVIDKNGDPAAGSTGLGALTEFKNQLEKVKIRVNKTSNQIDDGMAARLGAAFRRTNR